MELHCTFAESRRLAAATAVALFLSTTTATAATLAFDLKTVTGVGSGSNVVFNLLLTGAPPTFGGGFDLLFDPTVVSNVAFDCGAPVAFLCDRGLKTPGRLSDASGAAFNPVSGSIVFGSLTVTLATPGTTVLELVANNKFPWANESGTGVIPISFEPALLRFDGTSVALTAVPLPAPLGLLGAAVALLGARARKAAKDGGAVSGHGVA